MMEVPVLAASSDGRYTVSLRRIECGGKVRLDSETVCLVEDGREPRLLQPLLNWAVVSAMLSKDGVLALGLEPFPELYPYVDRLDETIAILDLQGENEFIFLAREVDQRNAPSVSALTFSDDGALLVAGGRQGVAVWDIASRALVRAIALEHAPIDHVCSVAISPDNGMVALAMNTGAVLLCSTFGDRKPFPLVAPGTGVEVIRFLDPVTVAVTFADGSTRRWNAQSGHELSPGASR